MAGSRTLSLAPLLAFALAGCTHVAVPPAEVPDRREIYQAIADALPRASLGIGESPAVVEMAASVRAEPKPPEPEPLRCNERGFMIHYSAFRPRAQWIPYAALRRAEWSWVGWPNAVLAPLLVVPLQLARATIVVDLRAVPGFLERLQADVRRLEQVSRELGLGGPWSHANHIKWKLEDDAALHGAGCLAIYLDYWVPVPAWLPVPGRARATAEAFAWVQAHPDEPVLEDEPEKGAK